MFDKVAEASRRNEVTRRSFLRGSGLLATAVGIGLVTSRSLFAQEPAKDDKTDDKTGDSKQPPSDAQPGRLETKLDSRGVPYQECPMCGANMYKEGNTWTCEACGYSYVES